jgi:hypothetical protein
MNDGTRSQKIERTRVDSTMNVGGIMLSLMRYLSSIEVDTWELESTKLSLSGIRVSCRSDIVATDNQTNSPVLCKGCYVLENTNL